MAEYEYEKPRMLNEMHKANGNTPSDHRAPPIAHQMDASKVNPRQTPKRTIHIAGKEMEPPT